MPDPTPTPDPTPKPKRKRKTNITHSLINKEDLDDLKFTSKVVVTAQTPEYVPLLEEQEEIEPEFVTQLSTDVADAGKKAAKVIELDAAKEERTAQEATAKALLMESMRDIQKAAKRTYDTDNKAKMDAYHIGEKSFGEKRETLEVQGDQMITQATTEQLAGGTPAKLTRASNRLQTWVNADKEQQKAIAALEKAHGEFKALVVSTNAGCRQIQLAADAIWPYTNKANAPIRRAFGLQENRPLV